MLCLCSSAIIDPIIKAHLKYENPAFAAKVTIIKPGQAEIISSISSVGKCLVLLKLSE